jgi:hypothetical protein
MTLTKREFAYTDTSSSTAFRIHFIWLCLGIWANSCRWTFLEKGIDSVMLKLEEGVDMKTVCLCPNF